jgi:hypothetical protein
VIRHYLDQLPEFIAARTDEGEISVARVIRALGTIRQLWDQRQALARMGVDSLSSHPFEGRGARTVAMGIATKAMGWMKPLPDELAIPLLNKAAWFLGTPADDVLRLLDVVRDPLAGTTVIVKRSKGTAVSTSRAGAGKQARNRRSIALLDAFEFNIPNGDSQPWHEPLDSAYERSSDFRCGRKTRIRQLWEAVRDSAAIIVQATSGMRVSELLGILAGIDEATGFPRAVRLAGKPGSLRHHSPLQNAPARSVLALHGRDPGVAPGRADRFGRCSAGGACRPIGGDVAQGGV